MKTDAPDARLLSALCHDLRGPLGALANWAQVLGSDQADEAARSGALAAMTRDIRAQAALIEEIAELADLLETEEAANPSRVELLPLLRSLLAAPPEGRDVRLRATEPGPVVAAELPHLRRALTLLLTGVKATPGVALEIGVSAAGGVVEVVLEGPGTPRLVGVRLARAHAAHGGFAIELSEADGRTTLRLRLPSRQ